MSRFPEDFPLVSHIICSFSCKLRRRFRLLLIITMVRLGSACTIHWGDWYCFTVSRNCDMVEFSSSTRRKKFWREVLTIQYQFPPHYIDWLPSRGDDGWAPVSLCTNADNWERSVGVFLQFLLKGKVHATISRNYHLGCDGVFGE